MATIPAQRSNLNDDPVELVPGAWSPVRGFDPKRGPAAARDLLPGVIWKLAMRRLAAKAVEEAEREAVRAEVRR